MQNSTELSQALERILLLEDGLKMFSEELETLKTSSARNTNMDVMWLMTSGMLVVFMQAGFSALEAGSVSYKNLTNILFKNLMDMSISTLCWYILGYGVAFGDTAGRFLGTTNFGMRDIFNGSEVNGRGDDGWAHWFFQWAFAGTASTIVSGSIAERTKLQAYLAYTVVMTSFIYPVAVHWVWGGGFLSTGPVSGIASMSSNGLLDFAGSGVVHVVGGISGLVGAVIVGPRRIRFNDEGKPNQLDHANSTLLSLGAFILWFGWYGFNCGSTMQVSGNGANVASKAAVTTTIAAGSACFTSTILAQILTERFDIALTINGLLGGLVAITASCAFVDPWMAAFIGLVAALVYHGSHRLLLYLGIDDPLDASAVHGACGIWGLVAAGLFCTDANVAYAGYDINTACSSGDQIAVQAIGVGALLAWVTVTSAACFLILDVVMGGVRVPETIEGIGLDTKHELPPAPRTTGPMRQGSAGPEPDQVAADLPAESERA